MSSSDTYWLLVPLQGRRWLNAADDAVLNMDHAVNPSAETAKPLALRALDSLVKAWKDESDIIRRKALRRAQLLREAR